MHLWRQHARNTSPIILPTSPMLTVSIALTGCMPLPYLVSLKLTNARGDQRSASFPRRWIRQWPCNVESGERQTRGCRKTCILSWHRPIKIWQDHIAHILIASTRHVSVCQRGVGGLQNNTLAALTSTKQGSGVHGRGKVRIRKNKLFRPSRQRWRILNSS